MTGWGLLLAPGANAGRDQGALVAIDRRATALGGAVRRFDFAYRRAGRRAPDKPEVLLATVREEAEALAVGAGLGPGRIFAGGRSMGGRMCSMAVADGMPSAGLVLVSYPLHPPGRPDRLRTGHFPQLGVPCLFISGERDPFGTPDELAKAVASVPGPVTMRWLPGDHSLRGKDADVAELACQWLSELT
jgi:predicted alpha/beta-hydrolase family hydrolase